MDKNNQCQHDHHSGGNFGNGFIFGLIVGAAIVFLLGTKKGKEILKTLAENGFEGITGLTDLIDEDDEMGEYEEDYEEEVEPIDQEVSQQEEGATPTPKTPEKRIVVVHRHPRPVKRLFRGVKR